MHVLSATDPIYPPQKIKIKKYKLLHMLCFKPGVKTKFIL